MTNQKDIFSYLVHGKCAHLAGIGGVSMSPLAEVLHGKKAGPYHIGTAGDDGVFLFEHRNRFFNGGGTIILVSC